MPERLALYATTPLGTEDLLAAELGELGAAKVKQDRGGVRFHANLREALHICLWTRIAMRVLYPLGEHQARGAEGLYQAAASVEWERYLTPRTTFAVDSTLKDSEHTHSGFVSLKIKDAVVDRLRKAQGRRPDVDTHDPDVRVVAHLAGEHLSLSLDLAGEPLHQRGYRVRTVAAPLKETLAAAVLRAAGYVGEEPLWDPLCGSGTFLIEAAMIAGRRAPGLRRRLSVERWPELGAQAAATLAELKEEAKAQERKPPHPIIGSDRDPDAVQAAQRNAAAAKVAGMVKVLEADAIAMGPAPVPGPGLIVSNPPYGDRLTAGGQKGMKTFYYKLGERLGALEDWRKVILVGNEAFESAFHARPSGARWLWNGPIRCQLLSYPAGAR
jgi:23S rRNA (guanine2445-N2)-methyltransferase